MESNFPRILSLLRKEKGISQKQAAIQLGISQSLLSHYEKGIRECGLLFVLKAADFYDVSCDYLLGRSPSRKGTTISVENLQDPEKEKEVLSSKALKLIYKKKILFCSLNVLVDILNETENNKFIEHIFSFLYLSVYRMFRTIFRINKKNNKEMFIVKDSVCNQLASAAMIEDEAAANFLILENKDKKIEDSLNSKKIEINNETLEKKYPKNSNALLNLIKNCESKIIKN